MLEFNETTGRAVLMYESMTPEDMHSYDKTFHGRAEDSVAMHGGDICITPLDISLKPKITALSILSSIKRLLGGSMEPTFDAYAIPGKPPYFTARGEKEVLRTMHRVVDRENKVVLSSGVAADVQIDDRQILAAGAALRRIKHSSNDQKGI